MCQEQRPRRILITKFGQVPVHRFVGYQLKCIPAVCIMEFANYEISTLPFRPVSHWIDTRYCYPLPLLQMHMIHFRANIGTTVNI